MPTIGRRCGHLFIRTLLSYNIVVSRACAATHKNRNKHSPGCFLTLYQGGLETMISQDALSNITIAYVDFEDAIMV